MNKKLLIVTFTAILFLGTFLRFYQLGKIPGSLEWDEASYGYNAYSILKTGQDEYGKMYPLVFRAFGEYKQPVYLYMDVLSISVFGLNAFGIRFPSAFFGSLSVIFVYLLVRELFKKVSYSRNLALFSMVSFAISPWSIQFSRGAFEANVALFFVISGVWVFLKGLNSAKKKYLFFATLLLAFSSYTYLSQKMIAPLIFIIVLIYGISFFKKNKKIAIILIAFFVILNSFWIADRKSTSRGQGVLFTSNQSEILAPSIKELQIDKEANNYIGNIIHNRRVVYLETLSKNYLAHFNPIWLFITGDEVNRHHAPGMGLLYMISIPFILLGIYFLLSEALLVSWILFAWLLIAPIPASLTFEAPHSLRSLIFLPTWQIFEAAGVIYFFRIFNKKSFATLVKLILGVLFGVNFIYYTHQYYFHTNTDFQKDWQYGYKEAIEYVGKYRNTDKRIVFSSSFEQPYIFYLLYNRYDPQKYIEQGGSARTSVKCFAIDNAYFGNCIDKLRAGDIFVASGDTVAEQSTELKVFKYSTGEKATGVFQRRE